MIGDIFADCSEGHWPQRWACRTSWWNGHRFQRFWHQHTSQHHWTWSRTAQKGTVCEKKHRGNIKSRTNVTDVTNINYSHTFWRSVRWPQTAAWAWPSPDIQWSECQVPSFLLHGESSCVSELGSPDPTEAINKQIYYSSVKIEKQEMENKLP